VSERSEGRVANEPPVVRVPMDPVELESRLAAIERRLAESEAREQRLLELIHAVHRLTEVVRPLVNPPEPEPPPQRRKPDWPLPMPRVGGTGPRDPGPVAPERIALAHARLRETLFAGSSAAEPDAPAPEEPSREPPATPAPVSQAAPDILAAVPPPGRNSWLRRTLKRMVQQDLGMAGKLVRALVPAHALAQLPPVSELPAPPEALAPLLVTGPVRRRIRWEKAQLQCAPRAVSQLVPLARMRASPQQLRAAGVEIDPALAFALVASAIKPAWSAGHRFALAHRGPDQLTYLAVRDRSAATVGTDRPLVPVTTTICCLDGDLLGVLSGDVPAGVSVLGPIAPLELVQRWFAQATRG
jgi:hypothetical protein